MIFPYQYDRGRLWSLPGLPRNVLHMCFHTPEDSLHVVWLSYLAAVDLILFIFLGSFLLFCLIFFFSRYFSALGICTLPWSGVALLSVLVRSGEVCVSAVPFLLSGRLFSAREMHGSKEVPIQGAVGVAGSWHG